MFEQFGKDQPRMARLAEVVDQMGPVKPPKIVKPGDVKTCAMENCANLVDDFRLVPITTPFCIAVDRLCDSCRAQLPDDYSLLVCLGCKEVLMRIKPGKVQGGFEYKKGGIYHTEACPDCNPELQKSVILEQALYEKVRREKKIQV